MDRNSRFAHRGGDGAPGAAVGIAHPPVAPRKTLTNARSRQRSWGIASGGGPVRGQRPLPGVGARWPMMAPIPMEVHFSDRAQWVVALHERRLGSD